MKFFFGLALCISSSFLILSLGVPVVLLNGTLVEYGDLNQCDGDSSPLSTRSYGSCQSVNGIVPCEEFQGMNLFELTFEGEPLLYRSLDTIAISNLKYEGAPLSLANKDTAKDLIQGLVHCGYAPGQQAVISDGNNQRERAAGAEALYYSDTGAPVCGANGERVQQTQVLLNCLHNYGKKV